MDGLSLEDGCCQFPTDAEEIFVARSEAGVGSCSSRGCQRWRYHYQLLQVPFLIVIGTWFVVSVVLVLSVRVAHHIPVSAKTILRPRPAKAP